MSLHKYQTQLDMFPTISQLPQNSYKLMRPHRWANKVDGELSLVEIHLEVYEGSWIWSTCLCSRNGSGQGYKPLPKWGKFAACHRSALEAAANEVRGFVERATTAERKKILMWLGQLLS